MSGVHDTVTRHTHRVCLVLLFRAKPLPPVNADQNPPTPLHKERGVRPVGTADHAPEKAPRASTFEFPARQLSLGAHHDSVCGTNRKVSILAT